VRRISRTAALAVIRALGAALIVVAGVAAAAPAQAASAADVTLRFAPCAPSACDVDSDGVADVVEEAICGSATCASGQEDLDGDGQRDADELEAQLPRDDAAGSAPDDGSTWAIPMPGGGFLRPGTLALMIYGLGAIVAAVVVIISLRRQRAAAEDEE
jgi:hypothetical protein